LSNNKHKNSHLQSAWILYGSEAFLFEILELAERDQLIEREQYYIDLFNSSHREIGYNKAKLAGSTAGIKASIETRLKQSAARMGKTSWNKGKKYSARQKQQIRDGFVDNVAPWSKLNWDTVRKIRQSYQEGKTQIKIAEMFGLFQTTVSEIIRNKIWKDETYVYERKKNK
jgi:group I intron endonuclease